MASVMLLLGRFKAPETFKFVLVILVAMTLMKLVVVANKFVEVMEVPIKPPLRVPPVNNK